MIIISHRANLNGPSLTTENKPAQIKYVLSKYEKIYVEIDVWYACDNTWWLGHDAPTYQTTIEFLQQDRLIIHAKNIPALIELKKYENIHYFTHNMDAATITSFGLLWFNMNIISTGGVAVTNYEVPTVKMVAKHIDQQIIGVCTDYPQDYFNIYMSLI
jgi:hypothetical protein